MKKLLLIALCSISVNCLAEDFKGDYAFSACEDTYLKKSNEHQLNGRFSYQVSNASPLSQAFNVLYKICDDKNTCNTWAKVIYVQPNHIHGTREVIVSVTPTWHPTGAYPFTVTTDISNSRGVVVEHAIKQCNMIVYPDNSLNNEYESNM